jgi:SAM-dependent methyltransferase
VRLLDVATGTGRFLGQAARALPGSELVGVDLSPWYVEHAREQLERDAPGAPLRVEVANAESLPFADESFEVVTSIFLLHELPRRARRAALDEMRRVLVPGGLLVLEDAAQPSDAHELTPALAQFSKDLHEPFFADYQDDDLAELLDEAGFASVQVGSHFVSKVASAHKGPPRAGRAAASRAGGASTEPGGATNGTKTAAQTEAEPAGGDESLASEARVLLH